MLLLFILPVLLTCPCSVNLIILFIIVYFIIVTKTLHAESQSDEFIE